MKTVRYLFYFSIGSPVIQLFYTLDTQFKKKAHVQMFLQ